MNVRDVRTIVREALKSLESGPGDLETKRRAAQQLEAWGLEWAEPHESGRYVVVDVDGKMFKVWAKKVVTTGDERALMPPPEVRDDPRVALPQRRMGRSVMRAG